MKLNKILELSKPLNKIFKIVRELKCVNKYITEQHDVVRR